ncbi:MAG: DUF4129 domain-containing protein [Caulobacteraceae bacterium]
MSVGFANGSDDKGVARAFAQMHADPTLQFAFPAPERFNTQPPHWLLVLVKVLRALWPMTKVLIWVAIGALAIAGLVYLAIYLNGQRRKPKSAKAKPKVAVGDAWRPSEAQARALLAEADQMAAEGRFEDAAHLLLLRSVEDIRQRRPAALRPSLTSRDIARLEVLPPAARSAFTSIAEVVEASWFGGRAVDAGGFAHCRGIYEAFALPAAWAPA